MTDRRARMAATSIIVLTALLVSALAAWRLLHRAEPHVEPDRSRYPIVGIDLSAHNGIVDFDSVVAAGVSFVYLKASEGTSFRDKSFVRNYAAARRAGLAVGAYHFFRFDCDGPQQAANFIEATDRFALDLPPAIDVEESGNPGIASTAIISERLESMLAIVASRRGQTVVYTNKNGEARFARNLPAAIDPPPALWICSFTDPPISRHDWLFWQHSHCGRIPGAGRAVDMNTFNGDSADWSRFLQKCTITRPYLR